MGTEDLAAVYAAIDELRRRLENDADGIENVSLENYLEAMSAWLEAHQRKYNEPLTWELVGEMLIGAAIYE